MATNLSERLWHTAVRQCLDKGGVSGTFLIDLSKAFGYIFCKHLITKPATFGFDYSSFLLTQLPFKKKQNTKMNILYITKSDIVFGVTKGS